jgi:aminopeptidase
MDSRSLHAYAQVLLRVGVNLQQGQSLRLRGEPAHREFMLIVAEEAYRAGARAVKFELRDSRHTRIRADNLDARYLEHVPGYVEKELETFLDEEWALLTLDGEEDPGILDEVDKDRLAAIERAESRARRFFSRQVIANRLVWCIAPCPTPKWAEKVLGVPSPDPAKAVGELWDILSPILRLDRQDPVAAWKDHSARLQDRSRALNALHIDRLHVVGPGTDLEIGLMPKSRFTGGSAVSAKGITFIPNLPTEEVFTTPDFRRAEGKVRCTRPVKVMGVPVEGLAFEFTGGEVKSFTAGRGREAVESFLGIDAEARRIGEVALVDAESPVSRSGRTFHSILFDENAACHFALGGGCPDALEGGEAMSEAELRAVGCNVSLVHTDFMMGSPEVSVFGLTAEGSRREIIREGAFLI